MTFLFWYLATATVLFIFFEPVIKGGNDATEFFLDEKFNHTELKMIGALLWLPLFLMFLFRIIK